MDMIDAIRTLNDIASSQKGYFTTAQASARGVERYTVSRLERRGNVERLAKGVYRMGGAPSLREEDVFVAWLSLAPDRQPGNLFDNDTPIAMGGTAAWLFELGEIGPYPYEFCMRRRKQTQRPGLIVRKRVLDLDCITIVSGIPATTPEQTVLDLIDWGEDLSLVSNVLNDALNRGVITSKARLKEGLQKRCGKIGIPRGMNPFEIMTGGEDLWHLKMKRNSSEL